MPSLDDLHADWPALNRLLDEALTLPPEARSAWLQALPGDAQPFKATLERLLGHPAAASTAGFLHTLPKLGDAAEPVVGAAGLLPAPGGEVGPWRLLRELGEGGMGSVWLAERADGSLKRQVALKLPRLSWARGLAERMARERDILATLEHPHIARLYDAGVDAHGRPWLALEHVQGLPIDVFCRERGLDVRQRVQLLLQVCEAVAYAHSRLVIHRDLKPGNILVTQDGQAKLLDFGIAKLTQAEASSAAPTLLTEQQGRAFTPAYASPEQLRGEALTTASDVYSLGVVAHELLAGVRPPRAVVAEAGQAVPSLDDFEAPLASAACTDPARRAALRGDLDAILQQALRPQPGQRYGSVAEFAGDLQRQLQGLPVLARPDAWAERIVRRLRRHRWQLGAAAGVALALLLGSGVALWQASQAREAARLARQEAAVSRAVQDFLESIFRSNTGDQLAPGAARETTARELLDRGAARIDTELAGAPRARLSLLGLMAQMYDDLGAFDRQRALQRQRVALARTLETPPGDETVMALADLAQAFFATGQQTLAEQQLAEAQAVLAGRQALVSDAARLRLAVREASVYRATDPERAARTAEQALALARTLPPGMDLVLAMYMAAEARNASAPRDALPLLAEAIALVQARPDLGGSQLGPLHALKGDVHWQLRELDAAEASYRRALALEQQRGTDGPTLHLLANQLGMLLTRRGEHREAATLMAASWAWAAPQQRDFETTVPMVGATYGSALAGLGRLDQALPVFDRALQQARQLQGAGNVLPGLLALRAQARVDAGQLAAAAQDVDEAVRLAAAEGPTAVAMTGQAQRALLLAQGQAAAAMQQWEAERKARGRPREPLPTELPAAQAEAAALFLAAGDAATAERLAQQALQRAPSAFVQAQARQAWGESLLRQGRPAEAVPVLRAAVADWRASIDAERGLPLARSLNGLALALERTGQGLQAQPLRREAAAIGAAQRGSRAQASVRQGMLLP